MIYNLRLKLSTWIMKVGAALHPDISKLRAEIKDLQKQIGEQKMFSAETYKDNK